MSPSVGCGLAGAGGGVAIWLLLNRGDGVSEIWSPVFNLLSVPMWCVEGIRNALDMAIHDGTGDVVSDRDPLDLQSTTSNGATMLG